MVRDNLVGFVLDGCLGALQVFSVGYVGVPEPWQGLAEVAVGRESLLDLAK